jgi:YgiT-type zinc finger domain-containing protein
MKCSIKDCPGEYEEQHIVHTVKYKDEVIVIDGVPAEVCSICGDVLLKPETVRRIEQLLQSQEKPARTVPLYDYAA